MSVYYRYTCSLEQRHVEERRDEDAGPPSVCINDGAALIAGSLTVIDEPLHFGDLELNSDDELDVTNARIEGLQAASIGDLQSAVSQNVDVQANRAHRVRSDNPHNVTKAQIGLANVPNLKQNLSALDAPGVDDDTTQGYAIGSRWIDQVGRREFVCIDASSGAAQWLETTGNSGSNGTRYYFFAFDAAGSVDINKGWTAIPLDTEVRKDAAVFAHTVGAPEVTFAVAGDYQVHANVGIENSNGSRTDARCRLALHSVGAGGSTFFEVKGSRSSSYHRTRDDGDQSASIDYLLCNVQAGDRLRVEAVRDTGGGQLQTLAGQCRLLLVST